MTGDHDAITLKDAAQQRRRKSWNRYNAKRYAKNSTAIKARVAEWAKENPEKVRETNKRWRAKNTAALRWYNIKRQYGLSRKQWEDLFDLQGNACAICRSETPGARHGWHTDHIHGTKKVRGILCHQCNTMIGRARDNPDILILGAEYLWRNAFKVMA